MSMDYRQSRMNERFFPYEAGLLRCHPVSYALAPDQIVPDSTRCSNKAKKFKWSCTQCGVGYETVSRHTIMKNIGMSLIDPQPMSSIRKMSYAF